MTAASPRAWSLRTRLMLLLLLTTGIAFAISAIALLLYELRLYRSSGIDELSTQANLIGHASAPALAFDDAKAAQQNLASLRAHPRIVAAAIYRDGRVYASFAIDAAQGARIPPEPPVVGHRFDGGDLELVRTIEEGGEPLGAVLLRARYDLAGPLLDFAGIFVAAAALSMGLAALLFQRLQRSVTGPILALTRVAHEVIERRDYTQHVPKTSGDEVGVLVDAFNDMLAEVERRTRALEQADRRKDEFLATLAHELRNPLAPLVNALEILRRGDPDPATRARLRDMMDRQVRQLVRLIDDLLEVSRITTGKLALQRSAVDLHTVLRNALEIAEPALRERQHELDVQLPPQPLWVDGDATRLAQVFANLLNNAAKYTDPGGHVKVGAEVSAERVVVRVADDGIGIDPAVQQQIFELFAQATGSRERGRSGLGVGLTLARQLAELHGGTLEVASEGLGRGSCFSVTLPLMASPPGRLDVDAPHAEPSASTRRLRVLIADDNVDFANSLGAMLRAAGHRVEIVHDGVAALEAARREPPEVGLLDLGMPGLSGLELARTLREDGSTRDMLLVAISGWGQQTDRVRSRAAGFDHHLIKPVGLHPLLDVLRAGRQAPASGADLTPSA